MLIIEVLVTTEKHKEENKNSSHRSPLRDNYSWHLGVRKHHAFLKAIRRCWCSFPGAFHTAVPQDALSAQASSGIVWGHDLSPHWVSLWNSFKDVLVSSDILVRKTYGYQIHFRKEAERAKADVGSRKWLCLEIPSFGRTRTCYATNLAVWGTSKVTMWLSQFAILSCLLASLSF